ncbi:hypothetical protein [Planomonospora venezuelensis]|uniref:Lipoprotein n=2 Tax=Planomonospora venezuelensis TaxID=1999 RepID=A0A841D8F2_PLAVE|nr:hypothetical protein [Planomonospora venezuelensis]MBB5965163.1 hypothetical protein [Planomonospora venezuelensis]
MKTLAAALCLAGTLTGCGAGDAVAELFADPAVITEDAPFRGSPSEKFADGAAGIVIPEAGAVAGFSAEDVRSALEISSRMLQAAYLDRKTLLGGEPDAYAKVLDPEQRKSFLEDLDHKSLEKNTRAWVVSFAPGTTELVGDVVKVQAKLSPGAGKDENGDPELRVDYEARFVYAVRPAGKAAPIVRVMAYGKGRHLFWRDEPKGRLRNWEGDSVDSWNAGTLCNSPDAFLRPDFAGEGGGSGPVDDAYGGKSAPVKEGECGSVEEI